MKTETAYLTQPDIIELLKKQDSSALGQLYDEYALLFNGILNNMLSDDNTIQTALEETFKEVLKGIHTFDDAKSSIRFWLHQICRDVALTYIAKPSVEVNEELTQLKAITDHENIADRVFTLMYSKGYTVSQIAQALAITEQTVAQYLRVALTKYRKNSGN